MTKKVVISGPWHERDRKYLENSEDLRIVHFPHLNSIADFPFFIENAKQADLVILSLFGPNLDCYFNIPELLPFLHDTNIRKVYWTQDAQHPYGMALQYQKFFNKYYLNYLDSSYYMYKYYKAEPYWLPSCFFSTGVDELIELISLPRKIEKDIIFPYTDHRIDDRQVVVDRIKEKLSDYGLNYYLGKIQFGLPYLHALQESKICLNISTRGSLNIRNFEVLALNRILLAEKVTDHDRINMDLSHAYFFKRDLSNFDEALERALNDTLANIRTSNDIIKRHMLIHRYVEIINNELNTHYKVQSINVQNIAQIINDQNVTNGISLVNNFKHLVKNINHSMNSENLEEACKVIEEAVDKYPNSPKLLNLKGELLWQSGKIEEALKLFLYVKERWPYHIETLNNIATILCYQNKWDDAKKLLQKALRISPSNKDVLDNYIFVNNELLVLKAMNFVQKKMFAEANTILKKVLAINSQHINSLNLLAIILIKNGNFKEAKEKLSLILQIDPNNEEALQNLKLIQ